MGDGVVWAMTEEMVCHSSEGLPILVQGTRRRVFIPWEGHELPFRSAVAFPGGVHSQELVKPGSP
jgi:hypothetical protein